MRVKFDKKYWTLRTQLPGEGVSPDSDGVCDEDAHIIGIHPRLAKRPPEDLLITVIHECTHAEFPDLVEEKVGEFAYNMGRTLLRLGVSKLEMPPRD